MIWGAFSWNLKSKISILYGLQTAETYYNLLEHSSAPFIVLHLQRNVFIEFQQNNAPILSAKYTIDWLQYFFTSTTELHARFPDLNLIDNLWVVIVRDVCRDGRQFINVAELTTAARVVWEDLSQDLSEFVVSSMSDQCISVLQLNGAATNYYRWKMSVFL